MIPLKQNELGISNPIKKQSIPVASITIIPHNKDFMCSDLVPHFHVSVTANQKPREQTNNHLLNICSIKSETELEDGIPVIDVVQFCFQIIVDSKKGIGIPVSTLLTHVNHIIVCNCNYSIISRIEIRIKYSSQI